MIKVLRENFYQKCKEVLFKTIRKGIKFIRNRIK